jgi:hypothetical protein
MRLTTAICVLLYSFVAGVKPADLQGSRRSRWYGQRLGAPTVWNRDEKSQDCVAGSDSGYQENEGILWASEIQNVTYYGT